MRLTAVFRIQPVGWLGLPQAGMTMRPADSSGKSQMTGPVLDGRTGNLVSRGALPIYREDADAIRESLTLRGMEIRINDDFVFVTLEGDEVLGTLGRMQAVLETFFRHIMVEQGRFISLSPLQVTDDSGLEYRLPRNVSLGAFMAYDLDAVRIQMKKAAERAAIDDDRLSRALTYFEHACFLNEEAAQRAQSGSTHGNFLFASAFLHYWKAITCVLGDPSTDRDYQSRFRTFGLPPGFWEERLKPLKRVRDNADVAHHELSGQAVTEVRSHLGNVLAACRDTLDAYSSYLLGGAGRA